MEHLKKFNENIDDSDVIIEYVKNCFIELLDKGANYGGEKRGSTYAFVIQINKPLLRDLDTYPSNNYKVIAPLDKFITQEKNILDTLNEIDYSIEKVLLKYKIRYEIETKQGWAYSIKIIFYI